MTLRSVLYVTAVVDDAIVTLRVPGDARNLVPKDTEPAHLPEVSIVDTTRLPSESKLLMAASPGSIQEQETRGQAELVASKQLPTQGLVGPDWPRWEALGVKILPSITREPDPLFTRVELPPGWRKVATDHPLWTDLVDADGKIRATICYKAAFYDRHAHITLKDPKPVEPVEPIDEEAVRDGLFRMLLDDSPAECVCSVCGHEQPTMSVCGSCGSVRVVLVSVVRDLLGANWRDAFAPAKKGES